jgi:hypothetical protein
MKTKEQIAIEFKAEFKALLKKYNAEMNVEEEETYGAYVRGAFNMVVNIPAEYNKDHDCVSEWAEVNLGNYENGC